MASQRSEILRPPHLATNTQQLLYADPSDFEYWRDRLSEVLKIKILKYQKSTPADRCSGIPLTKAAIGDDCEVIESDSLN